VDDDAALLASLARLLGRRYHVAVAANGRDALAALAGESFDAVISDIDMPVMDGLALRAEVRARFPRLADRVLLMSGGTPHWFRIDPTIRFIAKPFTSDALEQAVGALLRG